MTRNEQLSRYIYEKMYAPHKIAASEWDKFFKANVEPLLKEEPDKDAIDSLHSCYIMGDSMRQTLAKAIAYGRSNRL